MTRSQINSVAGAVFVAGLAVFAATALGGFTWIVACKTHLILCGPEMPDWAWWGLIAAMWMLVPAGAAYVATD